MKRYIIYASLFLSVCATVPADEAFKPEFYAFFNGVPGKPYDEEAKMLKELGYSGISQVYGGGTELGQRVAAYKEYGLRVLSVYLEATETPVDAGLVKALGEGGMIELTVKKVSPAVVESIRQTAEMASEIDIRVAIYPHYGNAVATTLQALELVEKVNHPNLGIMFNLCHFLKSEEAKDLESVLENSAPHLFSVSTCGADLDGKSWDTLIQPLGMGSFPQKRLMGGLEKIDFKGPVGLQCYAIKGDKYLNLKSSIEAWQKILDEPR